MLKIFSKKEKPVPIHNPKARFCTLCKKRRNNLVELKTNTTHNCLQCPECASIEPLNLNINQWWNKCPKCYQLGFNEVNQERYTQRFKLVKHIDDDGTVTSVDKIPVFDNGKIVFDEKNPDPITCRSCGNIFKK